MTDLTATVAELRALLEKATPGPWQEDSEGERLVAANGDTVVYLVELAKPTDDAALIVAAVNALPDLLARLESAGSLDVERLARALWAERAGTTPPPGGANWAEQMERAGRLAALYAARRANDSPASGETT